MECVTSPAIWTVWPSYRLGSSRSFLMGVAPLQPERLTSIAVARIHGAKPRRTYRVDLIVPPLGMEESREYVRALRPRAIANSAIRSTRRSGLPPPEQPHPNVPSRALRSKLNAGRGLCFRGPPRFHLAHPLRDGDCLSHSLRFR